MYVNYNLPKLWPDVNDSELVTVCAFIMAVWGTFGSLLFGNKNIAFFKHNDPNSNVGCGIA